LRLDEGPGFTLNNNRQDPSRIRQCLAARVFELAGVPTPRCQLARVTVNGKDLGIYSWVEGIKAPFLERAFGSSDGVLLEGTFADFDQDRGRFEHKRGGDPGGDPAAIATILAQDDDAAVLEGVSRYF